MDNNYTPKKIGNFNIPKTLIETKVDTLAILELMLRKNIATWEEIDEIREAVVIHLNAIYPELQLSYSTPKPLYQEAGFDKKEEPAKPLFYTPPPPELEKIETVKKDTPKEIPLYQTNQPKILQQKTAPVIQQKEEIKEELKQEIKQEVQEQREEIKSAPVNPISPPPKIVTGPPKILTNPPRKKI